MPVPVEIKIHGEKQTSTNTWPQTLSGPLMLAQKIYLIFLVYLFSHLPKVLFHNFSSLLKPSAPSSTSSLSADALAFYFTEKIETVKRELSKMLTTSTIMSASETT